MEFKKGEVMKRMILPLLLCVVASVLVCQSAANQESAKIEKLFDDYFREYIALNPEEASELGLSRESGYQYDRDALNDKSAGGLRANFDLAARYLDQLREIDPNRITKSQRIDAEILTWFLETQLEGEKFAYHKYYIDHLFGVHHQLVNLLTSHHTIQSLQDANDYLKRLEKIPLHLRQVRDRIDTQEEKGIGTPVFIIQRVIADMEGFTEPEPEDNLLYVNFTDKLGSVEGFNPSTIEGLSSQAESIISDQVYPAYDEFVQRLKVSIENADSLAGTWKLPNGEEYYAYSLKYHTSSSMTPAEVFQLGLKEVKRLQDECGFLLDTLGIPDGETFGERMSQYRSTWRTPELEDKFYYPEGDKKRQMVLGDYQSLLDGALARLPEAFSYIAKTPVKVEPVPEYKEQTGLTYYEPASLDGKRKATFHVNMGYTMAKPGMPSLVYHETIPGHHYQFAVQQELTQGRMFKNLFFITGFAEGWAMYVQSLAMELGWLPDVYARIEELNSQLFRAVRVVVDAGIHSQKWSKETALQYMQNNLGWSSPNEVDRYIVWPGQACSYTIGRLKIMELREKAQKELGPKFDLKEFHMTVLENGSLPLDLLEEIVEDYIAASS
jgi:uncharacterized protein (DUF885 family)